MNSYKSMQTADMAGTPADFMIEEVSAGNYDVIANLFTSISMLLMHLTDQM